ncbi:MAG: hypothetical protein Q9226_002832 [Calogaya cf. arnoldii]
MDQHSNANGKRKFQSYRNGYSGTSSATAIDLTDDDRAILALAGDESMDEDEFQRIERWRQGVSSNKKSKRQDEDSDRVIVGDNRRVRQSVTYGAVYEQPYSAPTYKGKQRRSKHSKIPMEEAEYENDVPSASAGPVSRTPTQLPEASLDVRNLNMLAEAARLAEQNNIPCTSPNCPVDHPHGEGLYRFEGEVPNSELANQYFSPSVPPPVVVKAFNALDLPTLKDHGLQNRVFEYHTRPCRPSKHFQLMRRYQCHSKICGVDWQPHNEGVYLHDGVDASIHQARRSHHVFGISNPPPAIWDSFFRVQDGNATDRDRERVDDFNAHHVDFIPGDARRPGLHKWQKERRNERPW